MSLLLYELSLNNRIKYFQRLYAVSVSYLVKQAISKLIGIQQIYYK